MKQPLIGVGRTSAMYRASRDSIQLQAANRNWTRVVQKDTGVELQYGAIHTDGTEERAIATRFYDDQGRQHDTIQVHL